jgi:predicted aminopeptidase
VADWLNDPATAAPLRERLALAQQIRAFAVQDLKLPDTASYRRYAELTRPYAVWNVVAAPELSLQLKTWCFPVVGCVGYRGHYRREDAEKLAAELRADIAAHWETSVYGVSAYSTLGKTDWLGGDPLLSTFIQWPDIELARLLFHEMAHAVAYADDDTAFNESYATAVERIGGRLWLQQQAGGAAAGDSDALDLRRQEFRELTGRTRSALLALYEGPLPDEDKRRAKAALFAAMRAEHERLKRERWGGDARYDGWMARANNASLAVQGSYDDLVPAFEMLYVRLGGDFARFHAEVRRLAALPKAERRARLLNNDN